LIHLTTCCIGNLSTGYISPKYHIVFDDWFDTVYATEEAMPPNWGDMCIMQRFETVFDENQDPPYLAEEWMIPKEATKNWARCQVQELQQGRKLYHEVSSNQQRNTARLMLGKLFLHPRLLLHYLPLPIFLHWRILWEPLHQTQGSNLPKNLIIGLEFNLQLLLLIEPTIMTYSLQKQVNIPAEEGLSIYG
jgi:hypothetical protein